MPKMGFLLSQTLNVASIYLRVFKLKCINWIIFPRKQPLGIPLVVQLRFKMWGKRILLIYFQKLPDFISFFSLAISYHLERILRNCLDVYVIRRLDFLLFNKTIGGKLSLGIVQINGIFTRVLAILLHKNLKSH